MKKILLVCCLFLVTIKAFSQKFSQYNTGTLYDSFENPSQRSFIPDSSRQYAFNFLFPSINANSFFTGDAQTVLKSRLFTGTYKNTSDLSVGPGKNNYLNANASAYLFMFKIFTSQEGNQELGFFIKTSAESRGSITNESFALFGGYDNFPQNSYNNIFNDRFSYQVYHQYGMTYREQVTPKLALGVKLSLLSGLDYRKYTFYGSGINFDKANNSALLSLTGVAYSGGLPNDPTLLQASGLAFKNPGIAVSAGATYKNDDGYNFQFNLKDLGAIHWSNSNLSQYVSFNNSTVTIPVFQHYGNENDISDKIGGITDASPATRGFYFPINGLFEVSVNKDYWLNYENTLKFSPTAILSKELFYRGLTGALVAPIQYDKYVVSLTSSYNDLKLLGLGGQFMIKNPNNEFFIGTDALYQTATFARGALQGDSYIPGPQGKFMGATFFIGFSMKFGDVIEHPMNSSYVPTGEKGFFGRLYDKIFNKDKNY